MEKAAIFVVMACSNFPLPAIVAPVAPLCATVFAAPVSGLILPGLLLRPAR